MQQSMTGYGQDERRSEKFLIKTEIKSLNSKFFDLTARYGKEFAPKEIEIRNVLSEQLKRGKIMLTIELVLTEAADSDVQVDEALFKAYFNKFNALSQEVAGTATNNGVFELALNAPEVIKQQELDSDRVPWDDVFDSILKTVHKCVQFRKDEGAALEEKLSDYTIQIKKGLEMIEESDENRAANIRARIQKNLDEIRDKVQVDENRFEQELIYYLEKLDITEEKVRLTQHLDYFIQILKGEEQAGKKLGFLAQEMGREINTIGSKANDAEIQRIVVMMKDELEKIKEQSLNIL
ncbi:MAG: YicC/YloC family endoribonuclease [Bacteroidota bacterium]